MNTFSSNGMGNKVAAANIENNNQNNNIETLKGMITAGHDGAKDYGAGECGITFALKWGEYNIYVSRTYGMWLVSIYKNYKCEWTSEGRKISYDAQILDRRLGDYARGKRWSMSLAENMAKFILDTIADYEEQEQHEEERFDNEAELMQKSVYRYQTEYDGYVEDLKRYAEKYDDIESRYDALICAEILRKIAKLSDDCLVAVGDICGCEMVWDDGYHIDLTEIAKWYGGTSYTDIDSTDLENIINTLDYMSSSESDLPLGLGQEDIDWIIMGEGAAYVGIQPLYTGETAYNFVMANV